MKPTTVLETVLDKYSQGASSHHQSQLALFSSGSLCLFFYNVPGTYVKHGDDLPESKPGGVEPE